MRTRVCITVDAEFSIGGALSFAGNQPVAEAALWCNVNGQSEGLGFMLDTFQAHDIRATFFVETAHRYYFKHDPMRPIAQRMHELGHEVQLHTHPVWSLFRQPDWQRHIGAAGGQDDVRNLPPEDADRLLQQGLDTFREWGLPRPLAFRSGNMRHNDKLYQALARNGIPYASNVGMAIFDSGDANYTLYSGRHERHGVSEFPVLTFQDWKLGSKSHIKSLTIAGTSYAETVRLLEQARQAEIPLVVILTHAFEYVHRHDHTYQRLSRNHLTQQRLTRLCAFLQRHSDRYDTCGFAEAAHACRELPTQNDLLKGHLPRALRRMAAQFTHQQLARIAAARTLPKSPGQQRPGFQEVHAHDYGMPHP